MKKVLLIKFLFIGLIATAQVKEAVTIQSSEKVSWSGGIAGRMGINYTLNLSWLRAVSLKIDSVWCNGYGYAINYSHKATGKNREHKIQYQLKFTEDKSTYTYNPVDGTDERPKKPKRKPPIAYKGQILIRYITNDKKKHYLVVKSFTKTSIVSYP